jgi:dCTP deaminase
MIFSNTSIHEALDSGALSIVPEPLPRKKIENNPCPYSTSAVDLRLGKEIAFFKDSLPVNIDLRRGGFADLFGPNSETFKLTEEQPFVLKPGKLVLGKTLEKITLPLHSPDSNLPHLAARVEGRSSYARCGLLVHFTAPTIHSGFSGTITLELLNLGPYFISLYPSAPICQLIVEEVHGRPFKNESQFHGQSHPGGN